MGENTIMISANEKHFALLAYFEFKATVSQSVSQSVSQLVRLAGSGNWNSISFSFQIKILFVQEFEYQIMSFVCEAFVYKKSAQIATNGDSKPKICL